MCCVVVLGIGGRGEMGMMLGRCDVCMLGERVICWLLVVIVGVVDVFQGFIRICVCRGLVFLKVRCLVLLLCSFERLESDWL